ncbi:MAG TPA: cytochrome c oxidase subunit 3 [Flavobacteriaceae bacterium]|nr:cytochrome c oxidase subunit 3 [Flavobacteriaceae bacterium]
MDLTKGTREEKRARAKKMMLWFCIISIIMMFAGFTSAYVVSSSRPDWVKDYQLPNAFVWSTVIIILSSISLFLSKRSILNNQRKTANGLLLTTFVLGVAFIVLQFRGFAEIIAHGYYFTGPASTINSSFIYIVVIAHLAHVAGGLIVLLVLIYNHFKQRYKPGQMLGLELGATFWHFVDFLWLYLFVFFIS